MGDTIQEIEDALGEITKILPTVSAIVGTFVPAAGPALTLASPVIAIANEILAAIETLKGTGMSHTSATAVIGAAVTHIGGVLTSLSPPDAADAAAPIAKPIPHETK